MSKPNSDAVSLDPRGLLRTAIAELEEKAEGLSSELAEVKAELRKYRTALTALTGKAETGKKTVTRKVVRDELIPFLAERPRRTAPRAEVDSGLRERLKASGYKLNGISRRIDEVLADDAFTLVGTDVALSEGSA